MGPLLKSIHAFLSVSHRPKTTNKGISLPHPPLGIYLHDIYTTVQYKVTNLGPLLKSIHAFLSVSHRPKTTNKGIPLPHPPLGIYLHDIYTTVQYKVTNLGPLLKSIHTFLISVTSVTKNQQGNTPPHILP